jgi:hypothetical protein
VHQVLQESQEDLVLVVMMEKMVKMVKMEITASREDQELQVNKE